MDQDISRTDWDRMIQRWQSQQGSAGRACGGCSVKNTGCSTCGPSASSNTASTGRTSPAIHVKNGNGSANRSARRWEDRTLTRREMLKTMGVGAGVGSSLMSSLNPMNWFDSQKMEKAVIDWEEYFKGNYRYMTEEEKQDTIDRLERRYQLENKRQINIRTTDAQEGVLFGYAFNISKCQGYRDCVRGCIEENNQDRDSNMQYIRIYEKEHGSMNLEEADAQYFHQVPAEGHFYIGTQCFQCENPPCVEVCPVGATWKEPDGIVVVDYDWCIGCRYCEAACPYWARRFNWSEPTVPAGQVNPNQHYLGNRMRQNGVMEKCTFCIQRSRVGQLPACVEACPTGARTFGNLLDPESEIRWILENKKVFRLKEELNTEPKFWYYMD